MNHQSLFQTKQEIPKTELGILEQILATLEEAASHYIVLIDNQTDTAARTCILVRKTILQLQATLKKLNRQIII